MNDKTRNLGPYEQNKIYCGKSEELMTLMPDDCVDLTVTSPPYDNLRTYNGFTLDWHEIIRQLYRVTKPGGVVVWVVADATINGSETGTSFKQALWAMECGFNLHDTMIYYREGLPQSINRRYEQHFEYMFIWSKGAVGTFNGIRVPCKHRGEVQSLRSRHGGENGSKHEMASGKKWIIRDTKLKGNIWKYQIGGVQTDPIAHDHPAIFPEALARDHIISWSNPGDLVLDPFVGSGTTPKTAMQNSRDYLGFDISEEYCELARKRVAWANPPLLVVD